MPSDPFRTARLWIEGDPDPITRAALQEIVDTNDLMAVTRAMGEPLTFGTAGIRGEVGPGCSRMNRATVIRTTSGLATYLLMVNGGVPNQPVALGFDARPDSRRFAEDVAGVLAAAGIAVRFFPEVTPTPLVAYAAKFLGSPAAVVITASHNPPADNGYKVYASNAAQIIPPVDGEISAAIDRVGAAADVPRLVKVLDGSSDLVQEISHEVVDQYLIEVDEARPDPQSSDLKIVYTPIHGVGGEFFHHVCSRAKHIGLIEVPEQAEPDGTFPTVHFPNPEEPGSLDLALSLAREVDADLLLANDPDADRMAAAIPWSDGWRMLSGNELGSLLGDYVLRNWHHDERAIVVNSVVSSPMLGILAERYDARHEVTLTGFKWIINAGLALEARGEGRFAFGYEEALGYSVGRTVRDKDGISAALIMADLVAEVGRGGLMKRLHELWLEAGLWVSAQHSIVREGPSGVAELTAAVGRLATSPPAEVAGRRVQSVTDFREGGDARPFWLGEQELIELSLGDEGRVLARPSGTEPKLKIYVDLRGSCGTEPDADQTSLVAEAMAMAEEVGEGLGI